MMIGLSYGLKMWAEVSFVLSHCTRLVDGQTDGQTDVDSKTGIRSRTVMK